jgi:hypothetical protein
MQVPLPPKVDAWGYHLNARYAGFAAAKYL